MRPVTRRLARTMQHGITRLIPLALGLLGAGNAFAQTPQLTALCSTDQTWCELAAKEFQAATGIKVLQVRKATGEALAQLRSRSRQSQDRPVVGRHRRPLPAGRRSKGLLEAYRPAYLNDLHGWAVRQYAMSGNMVGGFYTSAIGFGWNEDVLKKKKLAAPALLVRPAQPGLQG
jgi:iron(III) transport system substrate-binding protein